MKRIITTIHIFCIVAFLLPIQSFADGIKTAEDLVAFATAVNTGQSIDQWCNEKGEVCLEADINMAKVKKFASISSFSGVFDGKGHSILNWKAKSGLFDKLLKGGIIRNLIIDESCSMKTANKNEEFFCGFIANISHGLIENCTNYGSITHKSKYTEHPIYVGGIVGSSRWCLLDNNNYGNISSDCSSSFQESGVAINLGGVAGGNHKVMERKATVARCYNYGNIRYSGDFPIVYVGGVIGSTQKGVAVKCCQNKGEVSVSTSGSKKIRGSNVGGICGYTKSNMVDCDNFGKITSKGTYPTVLGGITGHAVEKRTVIVGCTNRGPVSLTTAEMAKLGGIVGTTSRNLHLSNCQNFGEVTYDGFSPDSPSYVGGIIGQIWTPKKAYAGAYLRDCVNYGKVFSRLGGNHHKDDKAIRTGGIAGSLVGTANARIVVNSCVNFGGVSSEGGKCSPVAALVKYADARGIYYDSYAKSVQPKTDGSNIFGRVVTDQGEPLAGVVVTDGLQCVTTDAFGNYRMQSDLDKVSFVSVSVPSGYEAEMYNAVPQLFRRVRRNEKAVQADFTLEYTGVKDDYTLVIVGDPQMRGLGYDNSGERYRDVVIPDIKELKGDNENIYAIIVGDLVYNWMYGYDDYVDISATANYPTYNIIGNHDMDQNNLFDTRLGVGFYENYIGPIYYSFNIGKMHYIVLNTIKSDFKQDSRRNYLYGLGDDQHKWLLNDLSHVSKDMTIVLCAHSLLMPKEGEEVTPDIAEIKAELAKFKKVYAWAGHSHHNYFHDYNYNWEGGQFLSATVSRCNGTLKHNKEIASNGDPNGYAVAEVKGGDMTWKFKCIGMNTDYQMKVYSPERTKSEYVKVNIWNWYQDAWTQPEWWENGVKVAELELVKEFDVHYAELHAAWKEQTDSKEKWPDPRPTTIFRIKPSEGVRKGEVRVSDYFGNTYTQTIEW